MFSEHARSRSMEATFRGNHEIRANPNCNGYYNSGNYILFVLN